MLLAGDISPHRNLLRCFATTRESQNTDITQLLSDQALSLFTDKFIEAAVRKAEGVTYYTDIIAVLRDEFLNNNNQTPHFISQGTGREVFSLDSTLLQSIRLSRTNSSGAHLSNGDDGDLSESTYVDLLNKTEKNIVTEVVANDFISGFFELISDKLANTRTFSDFYNLSQGNSSYYSDGGSRAFIFNVLSKENRGDELVTARKKREKNSFGTFFHSQKVAYIDDEEAEIAFDERHTVELNCSIEKSQLIVRLRPKFNTLQQLVLTVSCAPSLHKCYIFEIHTAHKLKDWGIFEEYGTQLKRRWGAIHWNQPTDKFASRIVELLEDHIRQEIQQTALGIVAEQKN